MFLIIFWNIILKNMYDSGKDNDRKTNEVCVWQKGLVSHKMSNQGLIQDFDGFSH